MLTRKDYESIEHHTLAAYGMRSRDSRGREHPEREHEYRSAFQRDRDRIVHASAFRRLEYKTQVFVIHEGDYYRTRLTHTMEAAQIARTLARSLRLNEDLTEAITLAHDLGHTPFGHSGEGVLDGLLRRRFRKRFEHNMQSLRIVEVLEERYPGFPGLNLTYELRESLAKHHTDYDETECPKKFRPLERSLLECRLSNMADEIAYNAHDVDDGLASGLVSLDQFREVVIIEELCRQVESKYPNIDGEKKRCLIVRGLINVLCTDLMEMTESEFKRNHIKTVNDVRACRGDLVCFSPKMWRKVKELKRFLLGNMYKHYKVVRMEEKAKTIITHLFQAYVGRPEVLAPELHDRLKKGTSMARIIADYIASMTDRFAQEEYKRLTDPFERV